jgi:hypothetical protein
VCGPADVALRNHSLHFFEVSRKSAFAELLSWVGSDAVPASALPVQHPLGPILSAAAGGALGHPYKQGNRMASIRMASPSAAAAFVLAGLLDNYSATADRDPNGKWEIAISLDGAPRGSVPDILRIVADWLDECGLRATTIALDNHTHLITADQTPPLAVPH